MLGLKWNATFDEAKKRFRKVSGERGAGTGGQLVEHPLLQVSLLVHPDRNQSSEEANQAFDGAAH